jgi:glycosyltransferase involved in cell wall biosynthesis
MKTQVDIIIPTYNRRELLRLTLRSILKQTVDLNLVNVIIVDDGSNDDTLFVVKKFLRHLKIKYIYQADKGYCVVSARNLGLRIGDSDLCILIDSGVLLESKCIEKHLEFHRKFKNPIAVIGYCHGFARKEDNLKELEDLIKNIKDIDEVIKHIENKRVFIDEREKEFKKFDHKIDLLPAPWAYFLTGHLSINRKCLESEEYFDSIFEPRYGYEDIDLGYRIFQAGFQIFLNTEAKAVHFPHSKKHNYNEEKRTNLELFYLKHKSKITSLFLENGGTKGFNEFIYKNKESFVTFSQISENMRV